MTIIPLEHNQNRSVDKIKIFMGDLVNLKIEGEKGTIDLGVDAIVNSANSALLPGGGLSNAIHKKAGPELTKECEILDSCEIGEAKITKGYGIPVKYIIHTVGPIWEGGENNEAELLASCYKNSLELAIKHGIKTIAFPAISTGAHAYPPIEAARLAMKTVVSFLDSHPEIQLVFFVTDWGNYYCCSSALAELSYGS